jgi:hypothetical protein
MENENESILEAFNEVEQSFYDLKNINNDKIKLEDEDPKLKENFATQNVFTKIDTLIKTIEKFFKKLKKVFVFTRKKAIAIAATIFIPFVGQLYARYALLDGSLHMPYLFLISYPPFSIVVAFLMLFGVIEKGKGGKPLDHYIYIPLIAYTLSNLLFLISDNEKFIKIMQVAIIQLSLYITFTLRSNSVCKKYAYNKTLIIQTLIGYLIIILLPVILEYIPTIGNVYKVFLTIMPISHVLVDLIVIAFVYIVMNMITGTLDKVFCDNNDISKQFILFLFILSIIFTITIELKKNSPFS